MPRDVDCYPIFTNSFVEARNAKNTRGFGMKSKGKTQDTNTHNTINVRICSAWLERPNPIELQRKDREVEFLGTN